MTKRILKLINIKEPYASMERFKIDLSLSENPLGYSPSVAKVFKREINRLNNYPDPRCKELRETISRKFNVPADRIIISNGSEQLINLIPAALLNFGDKTIIPEVTFPLIESSVIIAGGATIFSKMTADFSIDIGDIKQKITSKTKLIYLCNPNNPTGKILKKLEILKFIKEVQPINIIVDEANIEFGGESIIGDLGGFNNLIVLKTFSKAFGLAGLRIGVGFASENLIKILNKIQQPFPVNSLAQKCAIASLNDDKFIRKSKRFMDKQRKFLSIELEKRGFTVVDSQSNNILVGVDKLFGSATNFIKLLNGKGVSVVNGANFRGLNDKFVRVSPRLSKINKLFLEVIDNLIEDRLQST